MKRHINITVILLLTFCTASYAQNQTDTLRTRARIAELTVQRNQLKQRIATEDKKRNIQIADVAPEKMEIINLRQDSLCLTLRSQMTEVELEIKELTTAIQGTGSAASLTPQGSTSPQQLLQSLRQNRPGKKEEETQKIE